METRQLIGQTGSEVLRQYLLNNETDGGTSRFLLDRLNGDQVAAILRAVLSDQQLTAAFHIQIPRSLVLGEDLPEHVLTDEKTVHLRHATFDKFGLILANTNDDQGQSLKELTKIGATDLKANVGLWVQVAAASINLPPEQLQHWRTALLGLQKAIQCSLDQFADYINKTRLKILEDSVSVVVALGWALPALKLPRDSSYFESIPEKSRTTVGKWQKLFQQAQSKRGCFLLKETSTQKQIEEQELRASYDKVKPDIAEPLHSVIEAFIGSPAGWNLDSAKLAEFEWERDNTRLIFSGIRTPKLDLIQTTLQFFEDEFPDSLTDTETQYLEALRKRGIKDPLEEDQEFYERHHTELESRKDLKAKWDKFVYGQPIECNDFLVGLVEAMERLFQQASNNVLPRRLIISTQKQQSKSKWLDLNADVATYFCIRYRGIEKLTQSFITWDTHWLFKYDALLEQEKNKPKYKRNTSAARASTEIKLYAELRIGNENTPDFERLQTQIVWRADPNAIGMELYDDLNRLKKKSLQVSCVPRELSSKKGRLQGLSLRDVGTLMAAFRQDRGSLIAPHKKETDIQHIFSSNLKKAATEGRITRSDAEAMATSFLVFTNQYTEAINQWSTEGISHPSLILQAEAFCELLQSLRSTARGDGNRSELSEILMKVGCVFVERGDPSVIVPPWHPLRLASIAIKARQVAGLLYHILTAQYVEFGDARLFFKDLKEELRHPFYPEAAVGYKNRQPLLLSLSDTCNDYSLMERPVRDQLSHETNEDPEQASEKLISIIQKYLELLPHERTNLSVALYNCDSIKLPHVMVSKLTDLSDDQQEARCQVILRHRDTQKLSHLYRQLVEAADADPESFVASEVAKDFIARLRIGVKADSIPLSDSRDGKFADIVFLQDVIARQATETWMISPLATATSLPPLLEHVPPRWSRKKPAARDDLKSTVYLVCPSQPKVGQSYLDMAYSVIKGEDLEPEEHYLPARQISFKNDTTQSVLQEVHRLGEWVVNYDELVERRQLVNQGIRVIRYQQSRTDAQNLIVSSNSSLNLLHVLVKRRLENLNLLLDENAISTLTERLILDANALSGDIVLRAAKSGRYASELMGVALSKKLLESELGTQNPIGWYFLDDYASWLGEKEGQIADILAISPRFVDGKPLLKLIISESKYVEASGLADSRKTSQKQLRDTVERIINALFLTPGRLDRDLWLSRIGDLLLTGIDMSPTSSISIEHWREMVRAGDVAIDVSGYSHVFVSGPSDVEVSSDQTPIPKVENCTQEVFSREHVRQLVLAYHNDSPLAPIRSLLGNERPWETSKAMLPAPRVAWIKDFTLEAPIASSSQDIPAGAESLPPGQSPPQSFLESPSSDPRVTHLKSKDAETRSAINESKAMERTRDSYWTSSSLAEWIKTANQDEEANEEDKQWLSALVSDLGLALRTYNLQAKVVGERLTPNAALIRFRGSDRLTVEDVEKKTSQLLTTHGINVINVLGQPGQVIVSVARPVRETLSLRTIWSRRKLERLPSGVNMSFVLGVKELDGEILYLNLGGSFEGFQQHAPHTLIAGATGSGKSVLLQNLLLDIAATNSESAVGIYLIDPKAGVDYSLIENLPHLRGGIIVDQAAAIEILEHLVCEMDRRYLLFRENKVKDLTSFNVKVQPETRLPVLFLVHDEFAEWMLIDSYKDAVSSVVQRLGVKARAAGIHLIFAAQRPDAHVLPVQLRDNLGNRLILRVESIGTSEISLGQKGAERLLGRGHLAARLTNESELIFAQVPILSDIELSSVTEMLQTKALR
jgi:DNA segregation ATPase FtsK/SpoIIIE, S-DNA-T family